MENNSQVEEKKTHNDDDNWDEPLIKFLRKTIRFTVKVLAILMTIVIFFSVADVVWVLYSKLSTPPIMILRIEDILVIFGAFMAVLIAIEIFVNITIYLRSNIIHVNIVLATALMAVARKVIILDIKVVTPLYLFGIAAIVLALGLTYWLLTAKTNAKDLEEHI